MQSVHPLNGHQISLSIEHPPFLLSVEPPGNGMELIPKRRPHPTPSTLPLSIVGQKAFHYLLYLLVDAFLTLLSGWGSLSCSFGYLDPSDPILLVVNKDANNHGNSPLRLWPQQFRFSVVSTVSLAPPHLGMLRVASAQEPTKMSWLRDLQDDQLVWSFPITSLSHAISDKITRSQIL